MKSNMPKIFRDAIPGIDAFSNAVERVVDVFMIFICMSDNGIILLGTSLS